MRNYETVSSQFFPLVSTNKNNGDMVTPSYVVQHQKFFCELYRLKYQRDKICDHEVLISDILREIDV